MQRFIWRIKQLLPLTYRTTYREGGQRRFAVWRMWCGRSFAIDDHAIQEPQ